MSFSLDWDLFYATYGFSQGRYVNLEKMVGLFVGGGDKMLELGAGSGESIPFFLSVGFGYHGVDGSDTSITRIKKKYPEIADKLAVGDFTRELPFGGDYDLIVDRASVSHNDTQAIESCIDLVHKALKPGGLFISSDWFSTKHSEFQRGEFVDTNTRTNYPDGQFQGIGKVHFSDEKEIVRLFSKFYGVFLQERSSRRIGPNGLIQRVVPIRWVSPHFRLDDYSASFWDIVVKKT